MSEGGSQPSPWVSRFAPLVPSGGRVLDVACGAGRHLRLFRALGHPVVGIDRNVAPAAALAGDPGVELRSQDLEVDSPAPPGSFDAVVVTNYLHRPLVPWLLGALAPGGVLLVETFAAGNAAFGRPRRPEFLLRPRELLTWAQRGGLTVVAYEHGCTARPAVVQRVCAVRCDADALARMPIGGPT